MDTFGLIVWAYSKLSNFDYLPYPFNIVPNYLNSLFDRNFDHYVLTFYISFNFIYSLSLYSSGFVNPKLTEPILVNDDEAL